MRLYGLIGKTLSHSFSEKYFTNKFQVEGIDNAEYRLFELESIDLLPSLIATYPTLAGLNVTIPYKESVIPFLDLLSIEAEEIGAVNCIKIEDGKLIGHNTDCYGFRTSLEQFLGTEHPERALVLGTGGAHKAVCHALRQMGIIPTTVSRTADKGNLTYSEIDAEILESHRLIVNCTPLGTYPRTEEAPALPYELIDDRHYIFDLVYNPSRTLLMRKCEANGAKVMCGYDMLTLQAERSWEIWGGRK